MRVEDFVREIKKTGVTDMFGIPDSTLKQFCDYLNREGGEEFNHLVPSNEGSAVGLAAGSYLATGKPACVYMQNSGIGNIVNPLTSIANEEVYGIPMLFLVGWRGEPGVHDEPQHIFMGKITESIFELLGVEHECIGRDTTLEALSGITDRAGKALRAGRQYAIIIKKNTFDERNGEQYSNGFSFVREDAIAQILKSIKPEDVVVSTTGKISREVYEQSDIVIGHHKQSFFTVGGMGHASMIAYGYALKRPNKKVYCIDGDGAVLMHMGSEAFIGRHKLDNLVHICINNEAHESVGGMPTGAVGMKYSDNAAACGYDLVLTACDSQELENAMKQAAECKGTVFIEIFVSMRSRADLGRPKESAALNKKNFMEYHEV